MLDTSEDLEICEKQVGAKIEEFFSPTTGRNPKRNKGHFGLDNGSFTNFDLKAFNRMLKKHYNRRELCRFLAVPDVVGSARRTIECFRYWAPKLNAWPIAFVCQDGQEDLEIPWDACAAVFIGGTTEWKMSRHAVEIIKTSNILGKWCHVGRVNTPGRYEYFESLGANSCDGTGLARYTNMRLKLWEHYNAPTLKFSETAEELT